MIIYTGHNIIVDTKYHIMYTQLCKVIGRYRLVLYRLVQKN